MSATIPSYAGTATNTTVTGNNWSPLANATGPLDGNSASAGMPTGGSSTDVLNLTNYGFDIPLTAVIDGVFVEVAGTSYATDIFIGLTVGGSKSGAFPNGDTFADYTYGSDTDLWGTTITPAQVNSSSFGVEISGQNTHGGSGASVDSVRITVYWHTGPMKIPRTKYYLYKVYDNLTGQYIGNLPNVSSDFQLSQDINTSGVQITVHCAVTADTSNLSSTPYTDESGNPYVDENGTPYQTEGTAPFTGVGTGTALIRDGNTVKIWEYGYYHPNGICMLSGVLERHTDNFGGDTGDNDVALIIYSDGQDLDDHLVKAGTAAFTQDQSQGASNNFETVQQYSFGAFNYYGQTFTVGTGFTNLGAITLAFGAGSADVTVSVYTDPTVTTMLTSITQNVSIGGETTVQFVFPVHIPVTAGTQYFFTVTVGSGQSIPLVYQSTNVYSGGSMYNANYGGGSGGGSWGAITTADLYFATFSTTGSTVANFATVDPSTGMVQTIMNDYISEGGKIGIGYIQATGLSLSYGFNTNTTNEGIQDGLSISPAAFYYYVDLGEDLLYFQEATDTADIVLTKGIHINKLSVVSTVEYVVNAVYVVGGVDGSGNNIYTYDYDADSIARYGIKLQVHTDSNIPDTDTAHAVGQSIIAANKDEQYQTSVTIVDGTMDITTLIPGKNIGFNGFGSYVDTLVALTVTRQYASTQCTLTLGILPKRTTVSVDELVRGLVSLQSVNNPDSPS
jgi:hypothetical protein